MAKKEVATDQGELVSKRFDTLLPDEDPNDYLALRDGMLREFRPLGVYQANLVDNLVDVAWDIARHRRLLAALLITEFRSQAAGVEVYGYPARTRAREAKDTVAFGRKLVVADPTALRTLKASGVSMAEIMAASVVSQSDPVAYHETRIADLEKRRRLIRSELEQLQSRRPPPAAPIDDAVEVK